MELTTEDAERLLHWYECAEDFDHRLAPNDSCNDDLRDRLKAFVNGFTDEPFPSSE